MDADILLLERAVASGLGEDRDDAVPRRRVIERADEGRDGAVGRGEREQPRREGASECLASLIEVASPGERIAGERIQQLAHVTGVEINVILGGTDHLAQHHVGEDLGNGPIAAAGSNLVEIETIERRREPGPALEHSHIRNRDGDDRTA